MGTTAGSAEHRAAIDDLERSLGPFDDDEWRADLSLLTGIVQVAALSFLADCETIVALAARVPRSPGDERGGTPWTSFVREVAVAKKISDQAAHGDVALAHALIERHPATVRALQAGAVPAHRARLLVELCARYDDQVAVVADRLLADRLNSLPPWRLKQEVELLALRLDPDGAARREAAGTAGRTASRTSLDHAQAEAVLTGPAPLVQRWWDALTQQARALKAAGDPRNLGALRFDLAVHADPRGQDGYDPVSAAVGIPDPAADRATATCPGADDPYEQDDAGSADAGEDAGESVGADSDADDSDGADADADDSDGDDADDGTSPAPRGLGVPLRDDARCTRPVQVNITVPAATALGLGDEPGWLDGYGWISAPLSRQLLSCAELRKACVAPHSGQLIDLADRVERPPTTPAGLRDAVRGMVLRPHELRPTVTDPQRQHDPSPALKAFTHARDRWCDGPTGAQVPAVRCDSDHEQPWPTGPTAACNLPSRSPRTHQLKHTGWRPARDASGTTWTSPAGQVAHTPRFDHPPQPPSPGTTMPDPDTRAAHDAALLRVSERPDDALAESVQRETEPTTSPEPTVTVGPHGWPDEPAF